MILIVDLIWIDRIIDNNENHGYIKIMKDKYASYLKMKNQLFNIRYIL